jgi:GNAT superfamily N-acetyltransferase
MAQEPIVERAATKQEVQEFIHFPWRIYKDDPCWVPPLIKEQRVIFSPRYPFFEHGEMELFVARGGGEPVGRVAAIIDRSYVDHSKEKAGFFGFFEAVNDNGVARALIDTVCSWAKDRGMERIRGPFNPSTNDECGLLVEGFQMAPMLMMPYNPPYYADLMKSAGLEKCRELYSYMIESRMPPKRLERIVRKVRKRWPSLTIRSVRLSRMAEELQIVRDIYNNAWSHNWGFVPITESEMEFMASRLKPLVIEDLILFAEIDGEAVAFIASLPDYNQVLKRLNGKIGLIGALKFLYYSKKISDLRTMLLGVKYGYQRRGIEGLLYLETFKRGVKRGFKRSELSWVLEDNLLMRREIEVLGGRIYKTYRLYEGPTARLAR